MKRKTFAALAVPALLVIILGFHLFLPDDFLRYYIFEPPLLMPLMNFIFLGMSSFCVCFLAAKSYYQTGGLNLALLGSGALAFGLTAVSAGWFIRLPQGVNTTVTIFNCGALLCGILHFSSSIIDILELPSGKSLKRRKQTLIFSYAGVLLAVVLIVTAALGNWMPVFYVQQVGPSMIRQAVLGSATILLVFTGIYLLSLYFKSRNDFFFWYALGLMLIAEGLLGVFFTRTEGGIIGWTGRCAQYTGGIYLLVAVFLTLKERSLEQVLSDIYRSPRKPYDSIFQNSLDGIILAVHDGPILSANPAACSILGHDTAHLRHMTVKHLFDSDSSDFRKFRNELDAGAKARAELNIRHGNGNHFPVAVSCAVFRDSRGQKLEILTFSDISRHKLAEKALRQAKETSEALNRIHEALHSTLEFDVIMQRIVAEGSALLGSDSAAVSLRRGDGWIVSHLHGMSSNVLGARMEDDQERHAALALKSRLPVVLDDAFEDNRFNRDHLRRHNVRSVLVAPLIVSNEALGVIFFNYHKTRHEFTQAEVSFSLQMATIAGVALANAQLFEASRDAQDEVQKINRELEQRVKNRTIELKRQYQKLEELNAVIKQLSRKTIEAMESDRRTLSKEIHDSIAGTLAALKMQLEAHLAPAVQGLPRQLMPLDEIVDHLTETIRETRNISNQLRSRTLDDFGLKPALTEHIQRFRQFYPGIEVVSQIDIANEEIPTDIQTVIYRVVQEALSNAGKHSAATQVSVKLINHHNHIWLGVSDNGCSFDVRKVMSGKETLMGYGIHSMRERVEICKGNFQINSQPGRGTAVDISIPI